MCSAASFWNPGHIVVHSDSLAALSVDVKLSSPKVLMNAFAAGKALVLDELSAELVLAQQVQGVLKFEVNALSRLSQGASGPESLINATCLFVTPGDDAFYKVWGK